MTYHRVNETPPRNCVKIFFDSFSLVSHGIASSENFSGNALMFNSLRIRSCSCRHIDLKLEIGKSWLETRFSCNRLTEFYRYAYVSNARQIHSTCARVYVIQAFKKIFSSNTEMNEFTCVKYNACDGRLQRAQRLEYGGKASACGKKNQRVCNYGTRLH